MLSTQLPGYQVITTLYEGVSSVIYRATQAINHGTVVIKTTRSLAPAPQETARLRHEFAIASLVQSEGVIRPLALLEHAARPALVLEDIDGQSLHAFINGRMVTIQTGLRIAIALTRTLADLHRQQIIHKDIKPQNIIVSPDAELVKLTDFGISSQLSREQTRPMPLRSFAGTLAYMSPEQTGRINRAVDQRSDFYSLGVTLYELFTGTLPFSGNDPVELVYAHIARLPTPPHALRTDLPIDLDAVLLKLLAKTPEDRYQSAEGLLDDLEEVQRRFAHGDSRPFRVGTFDAARTLQLSQRLYGREAERDAILQAFERVVDGNGELLLITGAAGAGKSALIGELHRPLLEQRGYVGAGKFGQLRQTMPYAALIDALSDLLRQILSEDEARLTAWRNDVLAALGQNGGLICDVIPELEVLIGPQPQPMPLSPSEAQHRFALVFRRFLSVFAAAEHPLVLFLDDLHWADPASLTLLRALLTEGGLTHTLLVGSYRDREVDAAHPLALLLHDLRQRQLAVSEVYLHALSAADTLAFVSDTLATPPEQVVDLADLVYARTGGNPFFVGQFLTAITNEGLLRFDALQRHWVWHLAAVGAMPATDNLADLLAGRIMRLPALSQRVLMLAACIGHQFDLDALAMIASLTPRAAAVALGPALHADLIVPLNSNYRLIASNDDATTDALLAADQVSFRFLHDQVQHAAYLSLDDAERQAAHARLGRRMLQRIAALPAGTPPDAPQIFATADHLNAGLALLNDPLEIEQTMKLDFAAGQAALAASAFDAAQRYLDAAATLLERSQHVNEALRFAIDRERLRAYFLNGHFEAGESLADDLLARSGDIMQRAAIYDLLVQLYAYIGRRQDALDLGIQGLRLLGVELAAHPGDAEIGAEIGQAFALLGERPIESLLELPAMVDEQQYAALALLLSMHPPAFFTDQNLMSLISLKMLNLTLEHGNSPIAPFAYVSYGLILAAGLEEYAAAYAFGKLALDLNAQILNPVLTPRVHFIFAAMINFWHAPAQTGIAHLQTAYTTALESGDLLHAGFAVSVMGEQLMLLGVPLDDLDATCATYQPFAARTHSDLIGAELTFFRRYVACLRGETNSLTTLDGEMFDEHVFAERFLEPEVRHAYLLAKLHLHLLIQEYQGAEPIVAELYSIIHVAVGHLQFPEFIFLDAMLHAARYPTLPAEGQVAALQSFNEALARFANWAANSPATFAHKLLLLRAEESRLHGATLDALRFYRDAITAAAQHGFAQQEALAHERAASLFFSTGLDTAAHAHLRQAHAAFMRWGASGHCKRLEQQYPQLFALETRSWRADRTTTLDALRTTRSGMQSLDLASVMKAAEAISSEIVLEKLLQRLMYVVTENAGAQRATLLLDHNGQLRLAATAESAMIAVFPILLPLDQASIANTVVLYVTRTREPLVLGNAALSRFGNDPHIVANGTRSLLCLPLLNQGRVTGLLYLENALMVDAFTADRVELLRMLSSQIVTAIENALLYANLEQLVSARTAELRTANTHLSSLNARLHNELNLANRVQQGLLPEAKPVLDGFSLHCVNVPAREVGGDFYAYRHCDDGQLWLALGDVSGKGMPAALMMAVSFTALQRELDHATSPGALLTQLDAMLTAYHRSTRQNCALCCVVIDGDRLSAANAACVAPLVRRADGSLAWIDVGGTPLGFGLSAHHPYQQQQLQLHPGDLVVLMSDGVAEAMNPQGEIFGFERVEAALRDGPGDARTLIAHLQAQIAHFCGDAEAHDDITLVAFTIE
jgi:predicted ATPase/serine phosphatase RsbU (regulator of sigma subunit)